MVSKNHGTTFFVLFGLLTVGTEEFVASPADLVYEKNLRPPAIWSSARKTVFKRVDSSASDRMSLSNLSRFRYATQSGVNILKDLEVYTHSLGRIDTNRGPLIPRHDSYYKILERKEHSSRLDVALRQAEALLASILNHASQLLRRSNHVTGFLKNPQKFLLPVLLRPIFYFFF